jgi:hypothetical protein
MNLSSRPAAGQPESSRPHPTELSTERSLGQRAELVQVCPRVHAMARRWNG